MSTSTTESIVYNAPEVNSGTTTSWIPLTTAWPSSTGCASSFFEYPGQPFPWAWDPGLGYFYGQKQRCLPPAVTTWHEQDHQRPDGFTMLSIRPIVCPAAFTTAATSVEAGSSTLVVCCPSGYDLAGSQPGRAVGSCTSQLTSGQTITYLASDQSIITTTLAISSPTTINAVGIRGWNVATPTSVSIFTFPTDSSPGSSPALSPGAKAGIGVGAALGGIGLLALIGAVFLLRRRQKVTRYDPMIRAPQSGNVIVHEMSGQRPAVEMLQDPAELSSDALKR